MGNIFTSQEKVDRKNLLFRAGVKGLEQNGWTVQRVAGAGKSSVRKITKAGKSQLVSIRTTQGSCIAFPRAKDDKTWVTLSEVDAVVPVAFDDPRDPKTINVHLIDGKEMRDRFDRHYAAWKKEGHPIRIGQGVWIFLYAEETTDARYVGAGAGLKHPPIATFPFGGGAPPESGDDGEAPADEEPLTIPEAKRRLALSLGVDPSNIKIIVEG